jgi:hypothetical protein
MDRTTPRVRHPSWRRSLLAASALGALIAVPALAAGPVREEVAFEPVVLDGGSACSFDVLLEATKGAQQALIWERLDERTIVRIVGGLHVRLTNLESGATIDLSLSGPGFIEFGNDFVFITTGAWIYAPDGAGVFLVRGLGDASDGTLAGLEAFRGRIVDLCAVLG